jgi:hypothetical protein
MTTTLRPELERPMPHAMSSLPVHRGFPVPWFVAWLPTGEPEFRAMDPKKLRLAVGQDKPGHGVSADRARCWTCGGAMRSALGLHTFAFLIGPMCAVNRISAEPPSHKACAEWSARNCPFLSRPQMVRREDERVNAELIVQHAAGQAITRNPGVALVWPTTRYTILPDERGRGYLFDIGAPSQRPTWWACGRPATRAEVQASIDSGLPLLAATCDQEEDPTACREALRVAVEKAMPFLPTP